ncbi:BLOC-1-related complex subunit 8-like [Oppia nitens]|uniref:BLOC-1-related complex subunit 8-like n=1 Tax=Oppia nitens TaxID=1686743 RepID=UPI0023DBB220|nr:BLOC-1-related complex subunit 8-like [Oppia nitens]
MAEIQYNDSDLAKKTKKTCEKISENMYILGNEPSLACFRIQEHCHKSVPQLMDKMNDMKKLQNRLKGNFFDLEYSIGALKSMSGTECHFQNIQELLKNSVFLKQQIDYEENVKQRVAAKTGASATSSAQNINSPFNRHPFQRFSGSFDLPTSLLPASLASVTSSASADLKDLRTVINQFTSNTPTVVKRTRTGSLSSTQTKRHSEIPQPTDYESTQESHPETKEQKTND